MLPKKLITVVVLLLIGFVTMATGQREEKTTEITIMVGSHGRYLVDETAEAFQAIQPNIKVKIVPISSVPQEFWQTYVTMFTARDGSAHIVGWYPTQVYHMTRAGWLTDLSTLYDASFKEELKKYDQTAIEINTIEGKHVGMPLYPDALMLYYRKDLLDKYGLQPPVTWADLASGAQRILEGENDKTLAGYIYQARKIEGITANFRCFQSGNGGEIFDENNQVVFNSPENLEIARLMVDLLDSGISPKSIATHNPNDDRIQFGNGDAVFMNNWPFAMGTYLKSDSAVYGKVAITRMVGKNGKGRSCLGGVGLGINNFSKDKDAAWEFLKYLTNDEWNKKRALRASLLPGRTAVYDDPEVKNHPAFKEFAKGAPYLIALPTHKTPHYLKISDAIQLHLNRMVSGLETPEQAITQAHDDIVKVLKEAK